MAETLQQRPSSHVHHPFNGIGAGKPTVILLPKCTIWGYNEDMKPRPQGPQWLDIDLRPYAGRYIALVEGRVAAVADTAEGAFARARRTRPRRMPVILKVDDPSPKSRDE